MERATRIELAFSAWEADVLPLNYTRKYDDYHCADPGGFRQVACSACHYNGFEIAVSR